MGFQGARNRSESTANRLKMYRSKLKRDSKTNQVIGGDFYSHTPDTDGRIAPNRKWFGNSRVLSQQQLQRFMYEMKEKTQDPNTVIVRQRTLPMSLLKPEDTSNTTAPASKLLEVESYESTFTQKKARKRPSLSFSSLEEYQTRVEGSAAAPRNRTAMGDPDAVQDDTHAAARSPHLVRGSTYRIHAELFKVVDSSDVIVQVLDARDPISTRSATLEAYLRRPENAHRHLVLLLNKVDLVPTWATRRWLQVLNRQHPTIAFHASSRKPFGKANLINLLRQFAALHKDRRSISVGICGFPSVGKSSVINVLTGKQACRTSPVPGETKIWQYVTLMKRVNLIDSPGVVWNTGNHISDTDLVLQGVVRVENLEFPSQYVDELMGRTRREYLERTYKVKLEDDDDAEKFLTRVAVRSGKLLGGGDADIETVARTVLRDWCRGKIPYFVPPPYVSEMRAGEKGAKTPKMEKKEGDEKVDAESVEDRWSKRSETSSVTGFDPNEQVSEMGGSNVGLNVKPDFLDNDLVDDEGSEGFDSTDDDVSTDDGEDTAEKEVPKTLEKAARKKLQTFQSAREETAKRHTIDWRNVFQEGEEQDEAEGDDFLGGGAGDDDSSDDAFFESQMEMEDKFRKEQAHQEMLKRENVVEEETYGFEPAKTKMKKAHTHKFVSKNQEKREARPESGPRTGTVTKSFKYELDLPKQRGPKSKRGKRAEAKKERQRMKRNAVKRAEGRKI